MALLTDRKFIHFNRKSDFEAQLNANTISDKQIVFLKDAQEIWTHGTYYNSVEQFLDETNKDSTNAISAAAVYKALTDDEKTIAAALNDLNDRIENLDIPSKVSDLTDDLSLATQEYVDDKLEDVLGVSAAGVEAFVNMTRDEDTATGILTEIVNKAPKTNAVNGAPLSNTESYFYGTSTTAAATAQKEVSIPSITSLKTGQIIVVKPTITSTVANSTIKLNNFTAYPMRYNNAAITTSTDSIVWAANIPSIWVFDGTYWVFLGHQPIIEISESDIDSIVTPGLYKVNQPVKTGTNIGESGGSYLLIVGQSRQPKITMQGTTYQNILTQTKIKSTNGQSFFASIAPIIEYRSSQNSGVTWSEWTDIHESINNRLDDLENVSISENYEPSSLDNEDLELAAGDTYEEAFGKLHKALLDNEQITAAALTDLDSRINTLHLPQSLDDIPDGSTRKLSDYATTTQLATKQDALVSGTNIKTINNESILGSGNITIQGGSGGDTNVIEEIQINESDYPVSVANKIANIDFSKITNIFNGGILAISIGKYYPLSNTGLGFANNETFNIFKEYGTSAILFSNFTSGNVRPLIWHYLKSSDYIYADSGTVEYWTITDTSNDLSGDELTFVSISIDLSNGNINVLKRIPFSSIATDISTLQSNVSTIQGDLSDAETNISTLQTNVSTISGKMDTWVPIEWSKGSQQGHLNNVGNQIDTLSW